MCSAVSFVKHFFRQFCLPTISHNTHAATHNLLSQNGPIVRLKNSPPIICPQPPTHHAPPTTDPPRERASWPPHAPPAATTGRSTRRCPGHPARCRPGSPARRRLKGSSAAAWRAPNRCADTLTECASPPGRLPHRRPDAPRAHSLDGPCTAAPGSGHDRCITPAEDGCRRRRSEYQLQKNYR